MQGGSGCPLLAQRWAHDRRLSASKLIVTPFNCRGRIWARLAEPHLLVSARRPVPVRLAYLPTIPDNPGLSRISDVSPGVPESCCRANPLRVRRVFLRTHKSLVN